MKNKLLILAVVICLTVLVVLASFISVMANENEEKAVILKEHNGSVALFRGKEIIKLYDEIVISVLPESDRELLKNGIVIESEEQLNSIIEDYDG